MNRKKELASFPEIQFTTEPAHLQLEEAYKKGMLKKSDLKDETYYLGFCRNAYVAVWKASENSFYYMREKFGSVFPEKIFHPEDDNGKDLFVPIKEVIPLESEKIKAPVYKSFILSKK